MNKIEDGKFLILGTFEGADYKPPSLVNKLNN